MTLLSCGSAYQGAHRREPPQLASKHRGWNSYPSRGGRGETICGRIYRLDRRAVKLLRAWGFYLDGLQKSLRRNHAAAHSLVNMFTEEPGRSYREAKNVSLFLNHLLRPSVPRLL